MIELKCRQVALIVMMPFMALLSYIEWPIRSCLDWYESQIERYHDDWFKFNDK